MDNSEYLVYHSYRSVTQKMSPLNRPINIHTCTISYTSVYVRVVLSNHVVMLYSIRSFLITTLVNYDKHDIEYKNFIKFEMNQLVPN